MKPMKLLLPSLILAAAAIAVPGRSAVPARYGERLQGFDYPWPVQEFSFRSQNLALVMAYMDIAPKGTANGRSVVLLHGKNFCAATWEGTIRALSEAGYRVLALDQIGFCKSSKPRGYQFSLQQLAANTHALLEHAGVTRPIVIGHSMGGMLAARYTLQYPDDVAQLVMVDPLGLEDWQAKGVPYATIEQNAAAARKTTAVSIKAYQLKFYYNGRWKPQYQRWVDMQAGLYGGSGAGIVAWNQAQTSDMIFTQPVVHEFPRIRVPTVLIVGDKDRTAPGANRAAPELAATLGRYDLLGKEAAKAIPGARLIEFPELGHAPQMEAPKRFHAALLPALRRKTGVRVHCSEGYRPERGARKSAI
jgi:pimeloyl-ACP methyl ester carboxylesterase